MSWFVRWTGCPGWPSIDAIDSKYVAVDCMKVVSGTPVLEICSENMVDMAPVLAFFVRYAFGLHSNYMISWISMRSHFRFSYGYVAL